MIGGIHRGRRLALRLAFVAAGLAFVVRALVQGLQDGSFSDVRPAWIVAMVASAVAAMVWIAQRWSQAARIVGGDLASADAVPLYFQGEVGKYLPGAIWAVVGRAELARRAGDDAFHRVRVRRSFRWRGCISPARWRRCCCCHLPPGRAARQPSSALSGFSPSACWRCTRRSSVRVIASGRTRRAATARDRHPLVARRERPSRAGICRPGRSSGSRIGAASARWGCRLRLPTCRSPPPCRGARGFSPFLHQAASAYVSRSSC